jgi:thiamine kinase-like enzyme
VKLPDSPEAITPEHLTRAFAERVPGAKASEVEVIDAHSGTTGRARLRVRWESDVGAPAHVFAKLAPVDGIQREMVVATGMGKREARFYAETAATVPVRVAAPYRADWNEDGSAYLMLIEDLAASGCRFPSWQDDAVADYAAWTLDTLAELHAYFWESPRLAGDLAWIEPPMRAEIGPLLVRSALEQFADEMPTVFRELGELYIEHVEPLSDLLDSGPQTLLHGDAHLGNLFLDGQRIGLLDWACTCRGPGVRDVAYFLCNSVSSELRREDEQVLLARYLDALASHGAPAPSSAEAFVAYRRCAVTSWVAATVTAAVGSRMQPIELGMRSMRRATDAIRDLETLELLREELGVQ